MGVVENFKRRWSAAAQRRRRARWYLICYFANIVCMGLGVIDIRFFLVGFLGMPYAVLGVLYSDPTSPKSRGAWYFYMFFGIALFIVLLVINFMDKPGLEIADAVLLAVLTHIAFSQLHLLLKARRQYFVASESRELASMNQDYLR
jgi:hypothetical protein